jgi:hypothetical protein
VIALRDEECLTKQLIPETLRFVALVEGVSAVVRILRHLHLPTEVPTPRPGRAPRLFAPGDLAEDSGVSAFVPCH